MTVHIEMRCIILHSPVPKKSIVFYFLKILETSSSAREVSQRCTLDRITRYTASASQCSGTPVTFTVDRVGAVLLSSGGCCSKGWGLAGDRLSDLGRSVAPATAHPGSAW